mgnify:CR=1 FL=1
MRVKLSIFLPFLVPFLWVITYMFESTKKRNAMKLKINFMLKTGIEGEIPVLAIMNFGYKEFDVMKQTYSYKPLRYYTGVKVDRKSVV